MASLTDQIKSYARGLGFDLVGIAPAGPSQTYEAYTSWLAHGYAGEMDYLARERNLSRRRELNNIVPGARSVIVVALNYATRKAEDAYPLPSDYPNPLYRGQVARYARYPDYHDLMLNRLEALIKYIRNKVGSQVQARPYVDTGPVLEREWAQRAGLGWLGKNTSLIHPKFGSWLLLGEVITDLVLDPDSPFTVNRCGTCTRCLDACPTNAFVAPGLLDARRCISYLTIEIKGPIPPELRPLIGNRIFGCDVCQEVCPWNRWLARPTVEPSFQPHDDLVAPDLLALLALNDTGFHHRFEGNPIKRTKRRGLLRNVIVALGNTKDPAAIMRLIQALYDPEPLVRCHTAWAIGQIGSTEAQTVLRHALVAEIDPEVRVEIAQALTSGKIE